ncbi:hypothetical protein [Aphanothece hegewaldii]|nr:hypothetical protein [Aphanothece hegewaldii]
MVIDETHHRNLPPHGMDVKQRYHGWLIDLISEPTGYSFRCWLSEQTVWLSDSKVYPTPQQALEVAYYRADLETACLSLVCFLNEIKGHCYYLSSEDHQALTNSILEFAKSVC